MTAKGDLVVGQRRFGASFFVNLMLACRLGIGVDVIVGHGELLIVRLPSLGCNSMRVSAYCGATSFGWCSERVEEWGLKQFDPPETGGSDVLMLMDECWLGCRDSNPDRQSQSLQSYR